MGLSVRLGNLTLPGPVLLASGCAGFGQEITSLVDLRGVGALCLKGLNWGGAPGNPPPRIVETPSGMLNAIGLQNVGAPVFLKEILPQLEHCPVPLVANFWGSTVEEYVKVAKLLGECDRLTALEMNISCPNIEAGHLPFGRDPEQVKAVVGAVRKATRKPLWVKLTPASDVAATGLAAQEAGADALTVINTIPGLVVDIQTCAPALSHGTGGLSGPAIRPIAVRMVHEVSQNVHIPVIGCGGIRRAEDALEFLIAGADAIQMGTALFLDPQSPTQVARGIGEYLKRNKKASVADIVGSLKWQK